MLDLVLIGPGGLEPTGQTAPGTLPFATRRLALDASAPRWAAVAQALEADPAAWQDAPCVLLLADDVEIGATGVVELFRAMRQHALDIAQPSFAWRSHFVEPDTLHNPSFVLRWANRIDTSAVAFSNAALQRWLPLMRLLPDGVALGRLIPAFADTPTHAAAIVDAVQALRLAPPDAAEFEEPAWPDSLQLDGPHRETAFCWGGIGGRGQRVSLFEETREEFLGLLTAGYACAVQDPQPIGEVFLKHFLRSLEAAPQALQLAAPAAPTPTLRRSPILGQRVPFSGQTIQTGERA